MAMAPPRAPQASAGPGPGSSAGARAGAGAVGAADGAELRLLMERLELLNQQRALASVRSQRLMNFLQTAGAMGHGTAGATAHGMAHGAVNGAASGPANGAANLTASATAASSPFPPSASPSSPPHSPFFSSSFPQHRPTPFAPCPDAGHPPFTSSAAGTGPPQRAGQGFNAQGDCAWQPQLQAPPHPMLECGDARRPRRSSADLALRSAEEIWAARGDATADTAMQARGRQRTRRPRASLDLPSLSSSASLTAHAAFSFGERDHVVSSGAHPAPPLDKAIQRRHSGHSGRRASLDMPRSSGVPTGLHPHTRVCPVSATSGPTAEDSYMRSFNSRAPSSSSSRYSLSSTSSRRRRTVSFDMDSKAAQYYGGASAKKRPSPGPSPSPSPSPGVPAARSPWSECGAPPYGSGCTSPWSGGAGAPVGPTGRKSVGDVAVAGTPAPACTGAGVGTQYFPAPPQAQASAAPFAPCSGNWLHLSPGGPWPQEPMSTNAFGMAFSTQQLHQQQQQHFMSSNASVRVIDADETPRSPGDVVMGESGLSGTSCFSVSPAPELVGSGMNSRSSSHSPTGAVRGQGVVVGLPLNPQDIRAFLEQRASDSDAETSAASDAEGFLGRPAMAQRRM